MMFRPQITEISTFCPPEEQVKPFSILKRGQEADFKVLPCLHFQKSFDLETELLFPVLRLDRLERLQSE